MITLTEAKVQLNIPESDTTRDVELQAYVDAASDAVERYTGQVGTVRTISAERHATRRTHRLWLHQSPVQSLMSVARVDESQTWNVADLDVDVDSGLIRVLTGPLLSGLLEVTYEAGHETVPANYSLAARIILQHLWRTQRGVGVATFTGTGETTTMESGEGGMGFAVPRRAIELLGFPTPVVA